MTERIKNLRQASTEDLERELVRIDDIPTDGAGDLEADLAKYGDEIGHVLDSRGAGIPDWAGDLEAGG